MKFFILLILTGCISESTINKIKKEEPKKSEFFIDKWELVGAGIYRGENNEVVCYSKYRKGGLSCLKKNGKSNEINKK